MADKEADEDEQVAITDTIPEDSKLRIAITFEAEGSLPNFSITLDGSPLLNVTYHREVLLPLDPSEISHTAERTVSRFEGLLPEKLRSAVAQLFVEAFVGHEKQPASFFEMLSKIDDAKKRVGVKRGKESKLSAAERDTLDAQYDELHKVYKRWKRLHRDAYKKHGRGKPYEEWKAQWSTVIKEVAEPGMQVDLFERLADPDPYISSPSEIAYTHLARENNYEVEYMKKVVQRARRSKKSSLNLPDNKPA